MSSKKFWKRDLNGKWITFNQELLSQRRHNILFLPNSKMILCPYHCKWEKATSFSDYEVTTATGEHFDALLFPYQTFSTEQENSNDDDNETNCNKLKTDKEGVSKDIVILGLENDEEANFIRIHSYQLDRKKIESTKEGSFELCRIHLLPYYMTFDFKKSLSRGSLKEGKLPKEISEALNSEMQKKVCSTLGRRINFPYPLFDISYSDAFFKTPFEINIYPLKSRFRDFDWVKADDPNIYKKACQFLGFKSNATIRKAFSRNPFNLIRYKIMLNLGFSDINVIARAFGEAGDSLFAGIEVGEVFFNYYRNRQVTTKIMEENYNFLKFFVKKSLEFRNESAVWRALTRDQNISSYDRYDAACMFEQYFDQLTEKTKKEIIREGLTQRNHDILAKLAYTIKNKNIVFEYDDKQLSLADHIDGWEFALPKDSYQLKDIGMSLHNCVASYVTSVKEKDCTIVYATKDEQYKLCIEVRELYILQCRTDRNGTPKREAFEVVKKWSKAHGLTFEKNSL